MQNQQRASRNAVSVGIPAAANEFFWTRARAADRFNKLVTDRAAEKAGPETWKLTK